MPTLRRTAGGTGDNDHHDDDGVRAGLLYDICQRFLDETDPAAVLLPTMDTGFTDSVCLRAAAGTIAYGFNPVRTIPAEVVQTGFHNTESAALFSTHHARDGK